MIFEWFRRRRDSKRKAVEIYDKMRQVATDAFRLHHMVERPFHAPFTTITIAGVENGEPMLVLSCRKDSTWVKMLTLGGVQLELELTHEKNYKISWRDPGQNFGIDQSSYFTFLGALTEVLEAEPTMAGKVAVTLLGEPLDGVNNILAPTYRRTHGYDKMFVLGFNATAIVPLEDLEDILAEAKAQRLEKLRIAFRRVTYGQQLEVGDYAKYGNDLVGPASSNQQQEFLITDLMNTRIHEGKVFNAVGFDLSINKFVPVYTKSMHKTGNIENQWGTEG